VHPLRCNRACVAAAAAAALSASVLAEDPLPHVERLQTSPVLRHLKPNPAPDNLRGPAEILAQMYVPEGFKVELVAAEPAVRQPIAFAFDDRGRIWVAEAYSYPTRRPDGEGLDEIVILSDDNGDGVFESRKVFAKGLNLVSGLEVGFGGVWVGAAPELLFIPDANRDDVPDGDPIVLLDGFGYQDTHECLNSFHWGPDGWLYGIQGVFNFARIGKPGAPDSERQELRAGVWRYHPSRHEFEIFAHGGSNPWGLDHDERGQLFMTHCRSYWGRGGTTHVIQNGQFWNQANANYAPFIIADPPADYPEFRNYLLASARYDHGAGGAGRPGSDAIYGGHSHVGTMIYFGDNWPAEFRGRLFTHNLHGHQINQQVNRRWGSGFDTVHAGLDHFFCSDPKYVAVDLQYGPDGAVYIIDWYDQQHCHNPNNERWDRGNGRVYRLQYAETYRPRQVHLSTLSDEQLVDLLNHPNAWFGRAAQRLLQERALQRSIAAPAIATLVQTLRANADSMKRLQALWTLHRVGALNPDLEAAALSDPDEYVRAWTIQLALEDRRASAELTRRHVQMAQSDPSPVVRLYLASALPRLEAGPAWAIAERLASHGEDVEDRNIPRLLWHGIAPRVPQNLDRAFALAETTRIPALADWIHWRAATLDGDAVNRAVAALESLDQTELRRRLAGLWLALQPRARLPMPPAWKRVSQELLSSDDPKIRQPAEKVAAVFGDASMLPNLRATLANRGADLSARRHAFDVLSRAADPESLPVLLECLNDPQFRASALGVLGRYDAPEVAEAVLRILPDCPPRERAAALNTLTRRPRFALALLDAIASGRASRDLLTAFHIRQLAELNHPEVNERITAAWGRINPSAEDKEQQIRKLEQIFNEAPLWAYDGRAGRQHFINLCASCHVLGQDGTRIGPELTGAGRNGIRYYLENIIDPNAVVGADFQLTTVETRDGDVISGLKLNETDTAITLRTTTDQQVIAKADIVETSTSELSLMPEGLLESLGDREQLELLKYLIGN
jgi:putative membrane-bound dehydrogenase-like protein